MVGEASGAISTRRFGSYEVAGTIAEPRSSDGSTIFIAISRPPKADASGKLALSFSPSKPDEATKSVQRPVVIKQIARNLVTDKAKLEAFLEAARGATTLRQLNVAEVESVGVDSDDVFLVYDCLLGETVASLLRRLQAEGDRLKPPLAAHIAAEVCAALDAGHSAGLIHGHLTPHDIFIGYDGSVHVFDIGVAEARAKLADGRVSGVELEYASPEVCRRETIDPRTDIFTLGIILWELLSGLSPFERAADADVVRAICDDSVTPPKNIVPGLPRELSAITLQALLRDRGERFQTAKALKSALDEIVAKNIVGRPGDHISKIMKKVFAARDRDKREMLKRVMSGASLGGLDFAAIDRSTAPARSLPPAPPPPVHRAPPAPPPDEEAPTNILSLQAAMAPAKSKPPADAAEDQPSVIVKPPPPPLPVSTIISTLPSGELHLDVEPEKVAPAAVEFQRLDDDEPRPRARPAGITVGSLMAIIGVLVAITVIVVVVGRLTAPPRTKTLTTATTPPPSLTVLARELVPPIPDPDPSPAPPTGAATSAASTGRPDDGTMETTTLHIETIPAQASIFIDGAKKGSSPLDLKLAKGATPMTIEIRHPGYTTLKERVVPDMNQRLKLTLVAQAGVKPTHPASSAPSNPYKKFE